MGENLSVNAAMGSASLSIPLSLTASRHGTEPKLGLAYDTSGGGSAWGPGWDLGGLSCITRSVRLGNPTYDDAANKDVFSLSGEEDLVPVYSQFAIGSSDKSVGFSILEERRDEKFLVRFYRPRIEGSFHRIERWTDELDPEDVHWRVFTRTNERTIFGRTDDSRICSVVDGRKKIFEWLPCEWYDCYGNAHQYEYKREDSAGVDLQ